MKTKRNFATLSLCGEKKVRKCTAIKHSICYEYRETDTALSSGFCRAMAGQVR